MKTHEVGESVKSRELLGELCIVQIGFWRESHKKELELRSFC